MVPWDLGSRQFWSGVWGLAALGWGFGAVSERVMRGRGAAAI